MLVLTGMFRDMAAAWNDALSAAMPELEIAVGPVEDRPERAEFMLTFAPAASEVARYPNLRFICSGGAGVDGIMGVPDLPPDIPVVRLVDEVLTRRMTQYIVHAVLWHYRRVADYAAAQARAEWAPIEPEPGDRARVGILGLGALGTDAAEKLLTLGCQVGGWSRRPKTTPGVTCHHGAGGLGAFLAQSDILVCLLPLTPQTTGLVDAAFLAQMPRGAYLINPARGGLVVDDDLLAALESGRLSGAALDVFNEEPLPAAHPYWTHPKVVVTPHMASRTDVVSAAPQITENVRRARAGEPLLNLVDREAGY